MAPTLQALGIDRLSIEDRMSLMEAIWESIDAEGNRPALTELQRQELERRLADYEAHPEDSIPWEQVKADALARFQR